VTSVALIGVGDVGNIIARGLATTPGVENLWLFARDADRLQATANDVRIAADNAGAGRLRTHTVALDLFDEDRLAAALDRARADVIVNVATMRSWFALASALPEPVWKALYRAGRFGPWTPINLAPALAVMKARAAAGSRAPVVNVSFPDGVNPVLAKLGLAPAAGAGNSEILASALRIAAAELLGCFAGEVDVSLIAHHFHLANFDYDSAWGDHAFWYRVRWRGVDVTERLNALDFKSVARRCCPHKSPVPAAVSAIKNVRRLLGEDAGKRVHCSSPGGLAGGLDVVFGPGGPTVDLPPGVTMGDALAILRVAARGDGIEEILPDGSVRFGTAEAQAMREQLGYDCEILRPDEARPRAVELLARFDALAARHRG
jgi:hypothetical protein